MVTVGDAIDRARAALAALAARGEAIDDEWQYVTDLEAVWQTRLTEVGAARGAEPLDPAADRAVVLAIAETERLDDPHRAIDWLSTFPQIVLHALGEPA